MYCGVGVLYYIFRPKNKNLKDNAILIRKQSGDLGRTVKMSSAMFSVIVGQFQIVSVVMSSISFSPKLPASLVAIVTRFGNAMSIDFIGTFSSFECNRNKSTIQKWYMQLFIPFFVAAMFVLWYCCTVVWFNYIKPKIKIKPTKEDEHEKKKLYFKRAMKQIQLKRIKIQEQFGKKEIPKQTDLDMTYEIIIEAAVNVLLIGMYKTVAQTSFMIFDCTRFKSEKTDEYIPSMLVMDTDIPCPHMVKRTYI